MKNNIVKTLAATAVLMTVTAISASAADFESSILTWETSGSVFGGIQSCHERIEVVNNTDTTRECRVTLTAFQTDSGRFYDTDTSIVTVPSNGTAWVDVGKYFADLGNYTVKTFVWDSVTGQPLTAPLTRVFD